MAARAIAVPNMRMGRRPMMPAIEAHSSGPTERPRAGIATVQLICSKLAEYFSSSAGNDGTVVVVMYVNMK